MKNSINVTMPDIFSYETIFLQTFCCSVQTHVSFFKQIHSQMGIAVKFNYFVYLKPSYFLYG